MTKALIVYYGNDPQYLAIVWHLAMGVRDAGETPLMLDLTSMSPGIGDGYNRRVLRMLRRTSPDEAFRPVLERDGFAMATIPVRAAAVDASRIDTDTSVRSALITFSRDARPTTSKGVWRRFEGALRTSALESYATIAGVLDADDEIRTVYVANGRFPNQRAALDAARHRGREIRHYEKGAGRNTYWLENHSPLDRLATQAQADVILSPLSQAEAVAAGERWMTGRATGGLDANVYTRFFDGRHESSLHVDERKVIGLFTSSQDEFASLGEGWELEEWTDQWSAFDHVLTTLEEFGHRAYLRVHPNFITKSHASFLRESRQLKDLQKKHPSLRIFWHDEPVDSYWLLDQSDAVVVWGSTIGLEASGRGMPVWHLAPSYYDEYVDVRPWYGPHADPAEGDLFYSPDATRALRFMAYISLRDRALPPEAIAIKVELTPRPGFGERLAGLAATGGAPTARIAMSSIYDAVRHRRWSFNRKALTTFLGRRSPSA